MDLGGEVSTTLTPEPVKPACLLPLAGLLISLEVARTMGISCPKAKEPRDIWPLDDRWKSRGSQAKRGQGDRNDGNEDPGRSLCRTGCGASACLSVPHQHLEIVNIAE